VSAAEEDFASGLLWDCGTRGLEVVAAPGDQVVLLAYFDAEAGLPERLASGLGLLPGVAIEPAAIPQIDWLARVREGFAPFEVGPFQVVPAWQALDFPASPWTLRVDPGRAFGTGAHETTQLCLKELARAASERSLGRVLDLGAGTGILALAALRLGARVAVALDNDPEATDAARAHGILNQASLAVVRGDGARPFVDGAFDLVLANVSATLLFQQRPAVLAAIRPGGTAILSGFLKDDVAELRDAYGTAGATSVLTAGEWAALVLSGLRQR
jgi:ribosomal protein L11 methyltransferase